MNLGIEISQTTVSKYMVHYPKPPSQTWRTFLKNHAKDIVSVDFFTVPTATFRVLYVFIILSNARRRIVHFNVTDSPTASWIGQQIVEVFPWDTAPKYLLRDRDSKYGEEFIRRVASIGMKEVLISAQFPWQNPYVERVIGSIRRECLDYVIIFSERHLRKILGEYFKYYHESRTHLGLEKDCPESRSVDCIIAIFGRLLDSQSESESYSHRRITPPRIAINLQLTISLPYPTCNTDIIVE